MQNRPEVLNSKTFKIKTGCGNMYVTITADEEGKPIEVFAQVGKSGGCVASQTEAIGRLVSLLFRTGINAKEVAKQLKGISCHRPVFPKVASCADAIGVVLEKFLGVRIKKEPIQAGGCPDCGGQLIYTEGCQKCANNCGYTLCS